MIFKCTEFGVDFRFSGSARILGGCTSDFRRAQRAARRKFGVVLQTLLHRAWDRSVQIDSFTEAREIFPNMVRAQSIVCRDMHDDAPAEEDALAAWEGASFVEPATETKTG